MAFELSVSSGVPVEGWRFPISIIVVIIGNASWAPRKIPPVFGFRGRSRDTLYGFDHDVDCAIRGSFGWECCGIVGECE